MIIKIFFIPTWREVHPRTWLTRFQCLCICFFHIFQAFCGIGKQPIPCSCVSMSLVTQSAWSTTRLQLIFCYSAQQIAWSRAVCCHNGETLSGQQLPIKLWIGVFLPCIRKYNSFCYCWKCHDTGLLTIFFLENKLCWAPQRQCTPAPLYARMKKQVCLESFDILYRYYSSWGGLVLGGKCLVIGCAKNN